MQTRLLYTALAVCLLVIGGFIGYFVVGSESTQPYKAPVSLTDSSQTLEFRLWQESVGLAIAGRTRYQFWLGEQWLESHPSYSGPDVEEWEEEKLERRIRDLERKEESEQFRSLFGSD